MAGLQYFPGNNYLQGTRDTLRTLFELCEQGHIQAQDLLKGIQARFSRPGIVLMLEKEDHNLLSELTPSLLTLGNTVALNYMLETERHSFLESHAISRPNSQVIHEASISSNAEESMSSSYGSAESSPPTETFKEEADPAKAAQTLHDTVTEALSSFTQTPPVAEALHPGLSNSLSNVDLVALFPALSQRPRSTSLSGHSSCESLSFQSFDSLTWEKGASLISFSPHRNPYQNGPPSAGLSPLQSFAAQLWGSYHSPSTSSCILEFKMKYSFAKHLIYSLLKGRTVVIHASPVHESVVRRLVASLSIFIVGMRGTWEPWRTTPVKLSELAHLRLIGLSKSKPLNVVVERYSTIFDYEAETLVGPGYHGLFIEDILTTRKQWPDEDTYLAYVHYLLFGMGVKGCLYYHLCCIGQLHLPGESRPQAFSPINKSTRNIKEMSGSRRSISDSQMSARFAPLSFADDDSRGSFFKKMNIEHSDVDIIEHFVDVIREQQSIQLSGQEQVAPVVHLDYSPCQVFKNILKRV
eukprot:TRINITY_DN3289_c0_g1_i3.p1 TRINITY_DN3289_c0_g1~~TRINITY_DN3289_c0_g1_i3.p1  ORF type:complete len:524 (+),score=82.46 TRINITY_DN3289_c0_g1_i3:901-2472(+)